MNYLIFNKEEKKTYLFSIHNFQFKFFDLLV